jgi:3-oxoacyl-[acyl-carrier-protein] synthase-3
MLLPTRKRLPRRLAVIAARKALEMADVPASKIDLIICATTTPEYLFPATACLIQDALGAGNAGAFDLSAACSGFVYGLAMARGQIVAGDAEYVLVIGAETLSRIVDWTDRETCILFGDGAGQCSWRRAKCRAASSPLTWAATARAAMR